MTARMERRVLVVSGRLLVAQGLVSLLEGSPQISRIDICSSLFEAHQKARETLPDAVVIDLPMGADIFLDRPMTVNGREIRTVVLMEGQRDEQPRLYVHSPAHDANLQNFLRAVLGGDDENKGEIVVREEQALPLASTGGPGHDSQPISLISARESSPSKARMPLSRPEP
jgi:DNA-binding NarL/FixJ family response regulator